MSAGLRVEHDSLGEVEVPAEALYGAHTVRALANFGISGTTLRERESLLVALMDVKAATAAANAELGLLPAEIAEAIAAAAGEVIAGRWRDQFPVDVLQGGGGIATHMNVNEVLANRAAELLGGRRGRYDLVHPNDHVNRSQSTNDVYLTAVPVAALRTGAGTGAELRRLAEALRHQAEAHAGLDHLGRTCLQDALPVPIAATHRAQAAAVLRGARQLEASLAELREVPLGATGVGTGLGAPPGFAAAALRHLAARTGLPLTQAPDLHDALANLDRQSAVAAAVSRAMAVVARVAQDLRLLASGPRAGIGEMTLPAVQVGSSFFPGKVNPVIPELVIQVGYEARGAAAVVEAAAAGGELELNVMQPVVAKHLLGILHDSARAVAIFTDRCVSGLAWNLETVRRHLEASYEADVLAAQESGYDAAVRVRRERAL